MEEKNSIAEFEREYPTLSKNFKEILKQQYELFAKKCQDYGMDNISLGSRLETEEEVDLSLTGIWIRCTDKMNRLKNLIIFKKKGHVTQESVIDTYQDIVNYKIISQLIIKNQWKK